ncbi:MAG TPA: bifunctional [glutamate--ammonia ligase]-adenylyl-L-tyrosine phosphorylase/[glutamate--ammonia-ligase] adenylyltransferase [Succinivibrionaceae bacterium]|nr:bifunctional [glutamate--ammonia ligase]-adenylyl-L-tyrosine phosphorylase/[glutamate--ammonia-ligase] adenylyltransferase [Succinivibrionaceae bacterium]
MLFNCFPSPLNLPELPEVLKKESDIQYERIKKKINPDLFEIFDKQDDFRYVLGMSDFIANSIFMYPKLCSELLSQGGVSDPLGFLEPKKVVSEQIVEGLSDFEMKHRLREIRRSFMVMIAWRDLTGRAEIEEVFSALCSLAECIISRTIEVVRAGFIKMYGDAISDDGSTPLPLLTFGMGKLGGEELNFSSDLDLMFCYPYDGETSGGSRSISFKEFFSRIVQRVTNLLSDTTVDSFCYRIDLRLRPFGDAGALVNSFDGLARYYETQGRTWERYALVKARLLGKDPYNSRYGRELIEMLRPFVFRRYLDYGAIESLRKLKHLIEVEVRRRQLDGNFKLGAGGIREVEFIVQTFELMRGGRIPQLQERSLRKTLRILDSLELLPSEVCEMLDCCYLNLRRLENVIQEFSDKQTQSIPENDRDRARLLIALNKRSFEDLEVDLAEIRNAVHSEFLKVIAVSEEKQDDTEQEDLGYLWDGLIKLEDLTEDLKPLVKNTDMSASLAQAIFSLKETLSRLPVGPVGRETLRQLMPKIIRQCAPDADPGRLFSKTAALIEKVAMRTTYLQLLNDNNSALRHLITLLDENALAGELIKEHPILLDELIVPQYLNTPPRPDEFFAMLQEHLMRVEPDDLEEQMEELRLFKKLMVLRIAMSDNAETLPLMKISDSLTWLAEAIIRELIILAWKQTELKFGHPENCSVRDPGFAIIAYGKLGGIELGYNSDLDMVFIRDEDESVTVGDNPCPSALFYQRLVQRFLHLSTTRMVGGVLYDLDMRLRPDGDSGLLITDIAGYEHYQTERAWTWEHQALVRARPIAGSKRVIDRFNAVRDKVLRTPRDLVKLKTDVVEMREKMKKHLDKSNDRYFDLKQSRGGMVDIEFIAQYLMLREAPEHPDMILWTDNVRILDECARLGILSADKADSLKKAYLKIRGLYHRLSLADVKPLVSHEDRPAECDAVISIWDEIFA